MARQMQLLVLLHQQLLLLSPQCSYHCGNKPLMHSQASASVVERHSVAAVVAFALADAACSMQQQIETPQPQNAETPPPCANGP